jgi:hypothetical protein
MTDYDHYYGNLTPFDEEVEALKDHLREGVAKEIKERLELLSTQNKELTRKLASLNKLEREAETAKRDYEMKLRNAEHEAKRTVQKEGLAKLLELLREPRYRVTIAWDPRPKCGNCDEDRRLHYTTPRGKEAFESCECAAKTQRWTTEELLVHEVARRSGGILAWYHSTSRYFEDDSFGSPTVLKAAEGIALEEMVKNPRDYGFTTEAAAAVLADALNGADA